MIYKTCTRPPSQKLRRLKDGKNCAVPSLHRDNILAKVPGSCPVLASGNTTSPYCRAVSLSNNLLVLLQLVNCTFIEFYNLLITKLKHFQNFLYLLILIYFDLQIQVIRQTAVMFKPSNTCYHDKFISTMA
jgi:hypothetical protein